MPFGCRRRVVCRVVLRRGVGGGGDSPPQAIRPFGRRRRRVIYRVVVLPWLLSSGSTFSFITSYIGPRIFCDY